MLTKEELKELEYYNNWNNESPVCSIVIPSYKLRSHSWVRKLNEISDNDIYVFVYDDDYVKSGYDKLKVNNNVHFVKIHANWRSLQKKRYFIQKYMLNLKDVKYYIMIDDDIDIMKLTSTKPGKYAPMVPIKQALWVLSKAGEKYKDSDYIAIVTSRCDMRSVHFMREQKYATENRIACNVFLFYNNEIYFRDTEKIAEDIIVWFDAYNNNKKWLSLNFLTMYDSNAGSEKVSLTSNNSRFADLICNSFKILKDKFYIKKTKMKGYPFSIGFREKSNPLYEDYLKIMNENTTNEEKIDKIYKFTCDVAECKKFKKEQKNTLNI